MPSPIASLGVGSNLDLSSLLDGLRSSEQTRLTPLKTQKSSYDARLTGYGSLQGAIEQFKSAAEALSKPALFEQTSVSANTDAFTVSASDQAQPGRGTVSVEKLASAQTLVAKGRADPDEPIGAGGTITLSLGKGEGETSESVAISLSPGDSSLSGIRDAINGADIGVDASIINDGSDTPYRLVLSSRETGQASQISVSVDEPSGQSALGDLLNYSSGSANNGLTETVAASDASLTVNGVQVTSASNTVQDAIQGVTLTLAQTTDRPVAVTSSNDDEAVQSSVEKFVSAYNNLQKVSGRLTQYDADSGSRGPLVGDSTVRTLDSRVRGALNTAIAGSDYSSLTEIGISIQRDGTMEVDQDKFDTALADNRDGVAALFSGGPGAEQDGVAGVLNQTLEGVIGSGGLLDTAKSGTERSIGRIGDRIERVQASIDSTIERYRKQFVELDRTLSDLNSTSSYLTQQLATLGNNNSGSKKG